MKKIILAFGLLGVIGTLMAGCGGNACDSYADAVVAKYDSCGVDFPAASGSGETACADSAAKLAECLTPCVEKLDCACIDAAKAADCTAEVSKPYLDCFAACNGTRSQVSFTPQEERLRRESSAAVPLLCSTFFFVTRPSTQKGARLVRWGGESPWNADERAVPGAALCTTAPP